MKDVLREVDDIPVTLVVAIAYATLAVVTGMMGPQKEFLERLFEYGALNPQLAAAGQPWRMLAHAFLHGHVIHLLVNLSSLWALGPALERSLGSWRFAVLYVVSALGGAIAVCLVQDPRSTLVVGGSGALFGMMGAAVAMNMRSGRHVFAFLDFEGPRRMLGTIVVNFAIGFLMPFISNTAHTGGLIAGFAVTFLWLRPGETSALRTHWRLATAALFAAVLFWCVMPVTRADWLELEWSRTKDPARREALELAHERAMR